MKRNREDQQINSIYLLDDIINYIIDIVKLETDNFTIMNVISICKSIYKKNKGLIILKIHY